jgi:FtsH-binding integral membrane protein
MTPDAISYDDYILGAMMLYVDIVRMFLYILMILGKKN